MNTMDSPVPTPRNKTNEARKPVPTPRKKMLSRKLSDDVESTSSKSSSEDNPNMSNTNTFSRRVRSISNASKQIAGDIGGIVNDGKKAVIATTRQSVRRLTRRFSNSQVDRNEKQNSESLDDAEAEREAEVSLNIFNSIRFESPIPSPSGHGSVHSYTNVVIRDGRPASDDDFNLPPPSHPPPPLPPDAEIEESIYDAPLSILSSSSDSNPLRSSSISISSKSSDKSNKLPSETNYSAANYNEALTQQSSSSDLNEADEASGSSGDSNPKPSPYESVFPLKRLNSDSESMVDLTTAKTIDRKMIFSRSDSWNFYDSAGGSTSSNGQGVSQKISNPNSHINRNVDTVDSTPILNPEAVNVDTESNFSVELRNSMYENYVPASLQLLQSRPSKSVLFQFDPLANSTDQPESPCNEHFRQLEQLLLGDLYGNLTSENTLENTIDNWSLPDSDPDVDFMNPPPPPVRVDSLPEDEQTPPLTPSTPTSTSKTRWFFNSNDKIENKTNNNEGDKKNWLQHVKEKLTISDKSKSKDVIQRPVLGRKSFTRKKGMLYKVQKGPVEDLLGEYCARWCILENTSFICYSDNNCDSIKENFPAESILSIQITQNHKSKYKQDNADLHCFELNVSGKSRGCHIFGSRNISERRMWMQTIAECLTNRFSSKFTSDFIRMGWTYIREGVSGKWFGAWLLLSGRTLQYAIDNHSLKTVDLRKARCVALQTYQPPENNPTTNDKGPNMLIDSCSGSLYFRMWTQRETKVWCQMIKMSAQNNGANIDEQQLTKNDVPVIVEKCINFIYLHGSMSKGIYRQSGVGSQASELLTKFREDAWAVQITNDKYTEHDVATVLKRFFRELPEPLLGHTHRQYLYQVSLLDSTEDRIRMYKAALENLSPIAYKTTQKLFGHLHFIHSQRQKNLMNNKNLASVWGPNLMHYDKNDPVVDHHTQDSLVVCQLIKLYKHIFPEDPLELEKETLMFQVLEKHTKSPQGAINNKTAGEFRIWIYFKDKDGETFNVAIGPNKSANDVCVELCSKVKMQSNEMILEEIVLDEKLVRPIHHTEKVLDVVLRWSYWDEPDRKDNYIAINKLSKYLECLDNKPPVSGELRFADNRSKNFKPYSFEFSQAKLNCYKDKSFETKLWSYNIEDILCYWGHEAKRNPQTQWTVSFIEISSQPKRTKSIPYFGNILAFADPTIRSTWLGVMLKARYPEGIKPPVLHVNFMSP